MTHTQLSRAKLFAVTGLLLSLNLFSCGDDSSSATNTNTILGRNLSGTYRLSAVQCFNLTAQTISASATPDANTAVETLVINGNALSVTDAGRTCTGVITGRIVFTASDTNSGTAAISGQRVALSSGTSCTQTTTLVSTGGGTITPNSTTDTYTSGETLPDVTSSFATATGGALYLQSIFTVSGSPNDPCYLVYNRQ